MLWRPGALNASRHTSWAIPAAAIRVSAASNRSDACTGAQLTRRVIDCVSAALMHANHPQALQQMRCVPAVDAGAWTVLACLQLHSSAA